jgi:hypothetical protein
MRLEEEAIALLKAVRCSAIALKGWCPRMAIALLKTSNDQQG